jgi:hypothetical protein
MAHIILHASFAHDDPDATLEICDAYPHGTQNQFGLMGKFMIPPGRTVDLRILPMVLPVRAEEGEPYVTRMIFVDHFRRKYKSQKIVFEWVGLAGGLATTPI